MTAIRPFLGRLMSDDTPHDSAWLDRDNKPFLESLRDRFLMMRPWSDNE